jgi:hypothetical protein
LLPPRRSNSTWGDNLSRDVARERMRTLSEALMETEVKAARRADQPQSINDTIVQ